MPQLTITSVALPDGSQTTRDLRVWGMEDGKLLELWTSHARVPGTTDGLVSELRQVAAWLTRLASELDGG